MCLRAFYAYLLKSIQQANGYACLRPQLTEEDTIISKGYLFCQESKSQVSGWAGTWMHVHEPSKLCCSYEFHGLHQLDSDC